MTCKNCKSPKLKKVIKIGKQPISSHFYQQKKTNLRTYSLDLYECQRCKLVQLKNIPKLDDMYGLNYGYRTSLSPLMINHMKEKADIIKKDKILKKDSNILDIGSNDGTFLNFLSKNKKINLFGMDPSAKKFAQYYDPNKFCNDIENLLKPDGKWILELSYFPLLLENLTYDQICHEHVTYYTLNTFEKVANNNNLKILDFRFNNINGGSIEITCAKKSSKHLSKKVKINKQKEIEKKITNQSYKKFNERIENVKILLNEFLSNSNNEIIGYGASTKGNIVLNHCNINFKKLKYICDANPYKYNRYTPGSNIKIISKKEMRKKKPKILLILIWSFRKEVIKQELKFIKNGGKLLFHLPMFHIVDKNNYMNFMNSNFESFSYNM
jgi:NDP-4-keto-2,6-dideoxyhexose 3-C-methyltransferase